MADNNLTSAINSLKEEQKTTSKKIDITNYELSEVREDFDSFFKDMKLAFMRALDTGDTKGVTSAQPSVNSNAQKSESGGFDLAVVLGRIGATLATAAGALVAANQGFIGMKDMKAGGKAFMRPINALREGLSKSLKAARAGVLGQFGLVEEDGKIKYKEAIEGRNVARDPNTGRLMSRTGGLAGALEDLRTSLRTKLAPVTTYITEALEKVKTSGDDFLKAIKNSFIGRLVGGVLNSVILRVIAFGMAIWDGMKEAFFGSAKAEENDETFVSQVLRGGLGFLAGASASFIGGFLDLVVLAIRGIVWSIGKLFFGESFNEDGTLNTETFIGNLLQQLDNTSFTQMILDGWRTLTDWIVFAIEETWKWIKSIFTWENIKSAAGSVVSFLGPDEDDPAYQEKMRKRDELNAKLEAERLAFLQRQDNMMASRSGGGTSVTDNSTKNTSVSNTGISMTDQSTDGPNVPGSRHAYGTG